MATFKRRRREEEGGERESSSPVSKKKHLHQCPRPGRARKEIYPREISLKFMEIARRKNKN